MHIGHVVVLRLIALDDPRHIHRHPRRIEPVPRPSTPAASQTVFPSSARIRRGSPTPPYDPSTTSICGAYLAQIFRRHPAERDHVQTRPAVVHHDLDRNHLLHPIDLPDRRLVVLRKPARRRTKPVLPVDHQRRVIRRYLGRRPQDSPASSPPCERETSPSPPPTPSAAYAPGAAPVASTPGRQMKNFPIIRSRSFQCPPPPAAPFPDATSAPPHPPPSGRASPSPPSSRAPDTSSRSRSRICPGRLPGPGPPSAHRPPAVSDPPRWPARSPPAVPVRRKARSAGGASGPPDPPASSAISTRSRRSFRVSGRKQERQLHILEGRQDRHQVVELENVAHVRGPPPRQLPPRQLRDIHPTDSQRAGGRGIDPRDQVQQRRLAAPGRPHQGQKRPLRHIQIQPLQRGHRRGSLSGRSWSDPGTG